MGCKLRAHSGRFCESYGWSSLPFATNSSGFHANRENQKSRLHFFPRVVGSVANFFFFYCTIPRRDLQTTAAKCRKLIKQTMSAPGMAWGHSWVEFACSNLHGSSWSQTLVTCLVRAILKICSLRCQFNLSFDRWLVLLTWFATTQECWMHTTHLGGATSWI